MGSPRGLCVQCDGVGRHCQSDSGDWDEQPICVTCNGTGRASEATAIGILDGMVMFDVHAARAYGERLISEGEQACAAWAVFVDWCRDQGLGPDACAGTTKRGRDLGDGMYESTFSPGGWPFGLAAWSPARARVDGHGRREQPVHPQRLGQRRREPLPMGARVDAVGPDGTGGVSPAWALLRGPPGQVPAMVAWRACTSPCGMDDRIRAAGHAKSRPASNWRAVGVRPTESCETGSRRLSAVGWQIRSLQSSGSRSRPRRWRPPRPFYAMGLTGI
jgi:hypothetical protein